MKSESYKGSLCLKSAWLQSIATRNLSLHPSMYLLPLNLPLHEHQLFSFQWLRAVFKELKVTRPEALIRGAFLSLIYLSKSVVAVAVLLMSFGVSCGFSG